MLENKHYNSRSPVIEPGNRPGTIGRTQHVIDYVHPEVPTQDKRWRLVQAEMRKHGNAHSALIQTLHAVQDAYGYLDPETLERVAANLRLPLSKVWGVATFYQHFRMKPAGKHTCVLCTGTACYIKGAGELQRAVEEYFKVKLGGTTEDGELSFLSARCVGACGLAPVVVVDGEAVGKLTPDALINHLEGVIDADQ